jgi:hypothetical protein
LKKKLGKVIWEFMLKKRKLLVWKSSYRKYLRESFLLKLKL